MRTREPDADARPGERERQDAYKAGRLAAQTGKPRHGNPHVREPENRTRRSDFLCSAWYAGYDFEVC